jgi:cation-transporting ATPase 13A2
MSFSFKTTQDVLHKHFINGLEKSEIEYQKEIFGICDLDIEVDGVFQLFVREVTNPFYIFQLYSVTLWFYNQYTNYAIVIVITTFVSLFISIYETRSNLLNIKNMAKYSCDVTVFRKNNRGEVEQHRINSRELVPGDVIQIPEDGLAFPCDLILMSGTVIVNEVMLTGESTPIIKTGVPNTTNCFDPSVDKKYILFAGTKIIQKRSTGGRVLGLVKSIGFNTEKGNLIRSILFPAEVVFKFQNDSIRYIIFMACLSVIGFSASFPFLSMQGIPSKEILIRGLDLITTTVPPALPACLNIGISYALSRLKDWGIICINRDRVNVAGTVSLICFDKTGTLTEDYLDIYGFRPIKLSSDIFMFDSFKDNLVSVCDETYKYYKQRILSNGISDEAKEIKNLFIECLSSCHSMTQVNGKLMGDPIDVKMFMASGWILNENLDNKLDSSISTFVRPPKEKDIKDKLSSKEQDEATILNEHYELGIVKRFDFSSKLQRMSVITKNINEPHYKVFCKGSPEKIRELCKTETIPANFNDILNSYTTKGLRVLGLASKMMKVDGSQFQKLDREVIESKMVFLGLLIVQNKLKAETGPSIKTLHDAGYKMVMATGDNILTAISVAKECELIKNDIPVWTCELFKEGNNMQLSWNLIDTFKDKEEVEQILAESEYEQFSPKKQHLRAESFSSGGRESRILLEERVEVKGEQNEDDVDVFDIDIENSPVQSNNIEAKVVIAITGTTFEKIYRLRNKYVATQNEQLKVHYDTFRTILQHGYIFARMSPEHKTVLVDAFRDEKFTVAMCGDGANDCGALRAADVGVSLSIEEASIAAHFTSNKPNISCLIKLFREGKNSLVSSIQTFKYMMIYSLIQFMSVTLLTMFSSYLNDNQFLVSDLFIIFPLAILIARTGAYDRLTYHQPTGALISIPIISSILIQTLIQFVAQYVSILLVHQQPWWENNCSTEGKNVTPCHDNTVKSL